MRLNRFKFNVEDPISYELCFIDTRNSFICLNYIWNLDLRRSALVVYESRNRIVKFHRSVTSLTGALG